MSACPILNLCGDFPECIHYKTRNRSVDAKLYPKRIDKLRHYASDLSYIQLFIWAGLIRSGILSWPSAIIVLENTLNIPNLKWSIVDIRTVCNYLKNLSWHGTKEKCVNLINPKIWDSLVSLGVYIRRQGIQIVYTCHICGREIECNSDNPSTMYCARHKKARNIFRDVYHNHKKVSMNPYVHAVDLGFVKLVGGGNRNAASMRYVET